MRVECRVGGSYGARKALSIPRTLSEAKWEQVDFERPVTDWEVARGFERA